MAERLRRWGSFPTAADEGIWATAATPAGLFEALGLALFARMTDLRGVRPRQERTVRAGARDPTALVVAYLGELLLLEQEEGFLVRSISARLAGDPPRAVVATVRGEPIDPARHLRRKEIKAITFHRLALDLDRGRARVIVDI